MNNTPPQYYIFFWRAQIFVLICNCAPSLSSLLVFGHVVGHAHPSIRYFLPSRPYFPDIRCPLRNTSIRLLNFKSPGQFRRNGTLIFCRCARVNLVSDMANPEMKCDWGGVFCCSGGVLTQHVETYKLLVKLRMIMGNASLTMRYNKCRLVEILHILSLCGVLVFDSVSRSSASASSSAASASCTHCHTRHWDAFGTCYLPGACLDAVNIWRCFWPLGSTCPCFIEGTGYSRTFLFLGNNTSSTCMQCFQSWTSRSRQSEQDQTLLLGRYFCRCCRRLLSICGGSTVACRSCVFALQFCLQLWILRMLICEVMRLHCSLVCAGFDCAGNSSGYFLPSRPASLCWVRPAGRLGVCMSHVWPAGQTQLVFWPGGRPAGCLHASGLALFLAGRAAGRLLGWLAGWVGWLGWLLGSGYYLK